MPKGCYHFYPDEAIRKPYFISNTASEEENRDVTNPSLRVLMRWPLVTRAPADWSLSAMEFRQAVVRLDDAIELNACSEVEIADNLLNDRW
ncbi:hypothetical protein PODO_22590 [Paenibacillus odorifer]|nr:hypothetical protein PODO_22590 [Paenibacillus odorifer]